MAEDKKLEEMTIDEIKAYLVQNIDDSLKALSIDDARKAISQEGDK